MRLSLAGIGVCLLALMSSGAARADDFAYLALGDMRGHLEPCGCDPATDMGGLRRVAARVEKERRIAPQLLLLILGNGLAPAGESALKTPFLLEGAAALGPTAYLLNETEFQRLDEIIASAGKAALKLPYVLSHAKAGAFPANLVAERIVTNNAVVLGYTTPAVAKGKTLAFGPEIATRWKALLKDAGTNQKVLLFAGSDGELERIVQSKLFDVIVSSNTSSLTTLPGAAEKDDERLIERPAGGATIYMTPIGAQGLLRGGKLMFEEAKDISSFLQERTTAPAKQEQPIFAQARIVTWLDPTTGGEEQFKELFARYQVAAKAVFDAGGAVRLKMLATTPYAGAEACAGCHVEAVKLWRESAHAHAMATLQAKAKHEDSECVACHVVGATADGGFVSMQHSPQLANVQCENCHGPRIEHMKNPTAKLTLEVDAKASCAGCHNAQHSPRFDFKTYWPKIQHK